MPLLTRRIAPSAHPLPEPCAPTQHNGSRQRVKQKSSFLRHFQRKHWRTITLFLLSTTTLLRHNLVWIWKNRYMYVNCPEVGFWLRQPFDDGRDNGPHILYLTAKFGPTNGTFSESIHNQVQRVKRLGVLPDSAQIVTYSDLPQEFINDPVWKPHVDSLYKHGGRGGGYWFWKPLLIERHLEQLQDGDFLIYSDSDMLDFFSWLPLLLETMVEPESNANLALYQLDFLEQEWTKRDVYEEFCPTRNIETDKSGQYAAPHLILRKSKATVRFIQEWIQVMRNFHWVNDEPSKIPNVLSFREHRHDQSLLSLLLKCKYGEPNKRTFPYTCLHTWSLKTFHI
jgi:hypothetical protein